MKSKHPYVERNLGAVVSIIRQSVQNSAAYEAAVELLKERRLELVSNELTHFVCLIPLSGQILFPLFLVRRQE